MRILTRYLFRLTPVLLFGLSPFLQGAASPEALITPQDIARLKQVSSAVIAPDGRFIAYTLSVPRQPGVDDDGSAWSELWVADWQDRRLRPFVTGKVNIRAVQWSHDSQQIAFLAKRGDDKQTSLYLIPVDGGEARQAAALEDSLSAYSLAPDGRRVAVLAAESDDKARKKLRDKGFKQEIYEEDWRYQRVWILDLFGDAKDPKPLPVEGHVHQVKWSPKGDWLALSVAPSPSVDDSYMRQRLRVVEVQSGREISRLENPGKLGQFTWSPDGQWLALVSGEDIHDPSEGRMMVVAAQGGELRDWAPDFKGQFEMLDWTDNHTLLYLASKGVLTQIGRVRLNNGSMTNQVLYGPGGPIVASISAAQDGQRIALLGSTPSHPLELMTLHLEEGFARRRTESNPWLEQKQLAPQEVVRYEARDGLKLEGILVRPLDEVPGQAYPMILSVHGGPESHVNHGWNTSYSRPGQMAAAQGMAVFYPNYRGSTGRGVAFSKLGQGDPAGKEFDDLVDAVQHLVKSGLADPKRVGITGGSYGGYATAWCSTRYSEYFAAGVMFVGLSDKISKVGTTDIADEEYYAHALKRPWEVWQFLLERSPIYHAGQSRTPLLILHGKDDPRVDVGQSREMYRHLKLRSQAPVRLVLYPGEQHGNGKAAARLDYSLRLLRWMEHYLKQSGGEMPGFELDYNLPETSKNGDPDEKSSPVDTN